MQLRQQFQRVGNRLEMLSIRKAKTVLHRLRAPAQRRRVFVAGAQRSGTNMLMRILERSFQTQVFHEIDPRAFDNFQMRERPVIHRLADQSRAPLMVIKALCEAEQLPELLTEFAPARAVWIVRRVDDVVNSSLRIFNTVAFRVREIAEDPATGGWRGRGMSSATQRLLRQHCHEGLDDASAVALFWYMRNVLFFERQLEQREDVLLLHYEDLVTHPAEISRQLFAFLGLHYAPHCSRWVVPSSIHRHRPPPIEPAVHALCEDLYRRFQALNPRPAIPADHRC